MARPTVHDVARSAGVSLATVDRVLNARQGVSEKTIEKVHSAIARIGYSRNTAAAKLAKRSNYRFLFLIPDGPSSVISLIENAINDTAHLASADRIDVIIERAPIQSPEKFVERLNRLDLENLDGVALMAPDTPAMGAAVARIRKQNIPVAALISNLLHAPLNHFIGIDNIAAGRTAARLLGRFLGPAAHGKILVITGAEKVRDHRERRAGFDEVMEAFYPNLTAMTSIEGWDDAKRVARLVKKTLLSNDDIVGIYSLAAGNQGLIQALKKTDRVSNTVVIAHELTTHSRKALEDEVFDALIVQDLGHIVRSAIRSLKASLDHTDIIEAHEKIRIEIILRENLPAQSNGHTV